MRILLVEDDSMLAEAIASALTQAAHAVDTVGTGEHADRALVSADYDLVLLDIALPQIDGLEVLKRLRARKSTVPVLIMTVRDAVEDRIAGLDIGADDYIVKPFSVKEVIARVRAVLRRAEKEASPKYEDPRVAIDFDDMRVVCDGDSVKLTRKEFALLEHLVKNTGRVATRQQLLDNVWGYSYFGDTRTLDVHIRRLRQKMNECGGCIETVVGVGYRFIGFK